MESPITFGAWLRQQRTLLRLTRAELARRVGCSVSALRKIEAGERRPSIQVAELIAASLGIAPAERAAVVRVARGEWSLDRLALLPAPIAGLRASAVASPQRNRLPAFTSPLIGRQPDVAELSRLLRDPHCRLLTLVGPGGIGKTRLALEAAAQVQDAFADGVYFVPLAPIRAIQLLIPVIADAIGFAFQSASALDPQAQLCSYLMEKQVLLLLDNLEQLVIAPGIEVLATLLAHAPQLTLLATARESLGLHAEWVFEVQGLPIPASHAAEGSEPHTAMALFLQCARQAQVGFQPAPADYPAIVRICRLVDGMPLAIELAAAWVRTLACAEIAHEIARGLDFLSLSAHDLPARHRSMRAVFDHSWQLLTADEQGLLGRLTLFRGGFGYAAAEAVAGATLAALAALVAKSLIRRSGAGRYDLHALIGQFAAEQLAQRPDEQAAGQARHGRYYLHMFSQADARLRSAEQQATLDELTGEMENFRAAWAWAVAHGAFGLIEPTLRTFAMLYDTRGWLQEGLDTLRRTIDALEAAHGPAPPDRANQIALGHLLIACAVPASRLGQYAQAQALLERSLGILRPINEPRVLLEAITFLGTVMELIGSYAPALALYAEGLALATAIGDRWFAALCRTCQAGLLGITHALATPEQTHAQLQAVVADWRAIGDPRFTAFALNLLGWNAFTLGRYDQARAALEESVTLSRSVGDRWGLGFAERGLGIVAQARGDHAQAVAMLRTSLEILTELGARQDMARLCADLGHSLFALSNHAEAEQLWRTAVRLAASTSGTFIVLDALVGLASLAAQQGEHAHALALLLLVIDHPVSVQATRVHAARLRAELEAQLTPQQIAGAQAWRAATTLEAVVAELLR